MTNLTLAVTNAQVVNRSVSCDISLYKVMHSGKVWTAGMEVHSQATIKTRTNDRHGGRDC